MTLHVHKYGEREIYMWALGNNKKAIISCIKTIVYWNDNYNVSGTDTFIVQILSIALYWHAIQEAK